MAKTLTFRLTAEGIKELERDLNALGANGQRIFDGLKQAAPGFADGLRKAEDQIGKTRSKLTALAKETSVTGKAFGAAGAEMERFAGSFADRLGPVAGVLRAIGPAGLIAAAGIGAVTAAFAKALEAAEGAERSQRKLESVLKATGNSAGLTGKQIAEFAAQMQSETLFGGSQIKEASARLATFRSISGDAFKRVIKDAADLATVFDGDLTGSVVKLGKALDDPIAGYDDLAKSGVRLSNAQRELITNFVKAGELAQAQGIILSEVEKRVGGAAEGDQAGLTGAMNRLSDAWGDFWENAGAQIEDSGVMSILNTIAAGAENVARSLKPLTTGQTIDRLQQDLAAKWKEFGDLRTSPNSLPENFGGITVTASPNTDRIKGEIKVIEDKIAALEALQDAEEKQVFQDAEAAEIAGKLAGEQEAAARMAAAFADELKRQDELRTEASEGLDKYVQGLRVEYDQMFLTGPEREKQNKLLALEDTLKSGLIPLDDKRIAQAREFINVLSFQSEEQAEINVGLAAEKATRDANAARQKEAAKAAEDATKELERQAEKQAETLMQPFENAADSVQRSFADVFTNVYKDGIDSFRSLADSAITIFTRLAGELTALLIFQPQLLGGGTGQAAGTANGVGVTGVNGGGSLTGGFSLQNLLSPNNFSGGQWNTGIGTFLFGSSGTTLGALGKGGGGVSSQIAPGTASSGLFGTGGGQASNFLNSPVGGGAFAGLLAGATTYAAGGTPGESIGAGVGGAIGGIAGSYFGPVGTMVGATIGSMLGKLVGGLFGKKDKYKKVKAVSGANLGFDDNGLLDVDSTFAKAKGKGLKVDGSTGGKLGDLFSDAFNEFFLGIGAEFDPTTTAQVQQVYQARVKGKKKKGEKNYFTGTFADEYIGTANTAEELLPMFLSGSLAVAIEKGLVSGVSDTLKTIFTTVFKDNGRVGIGSQDELNRMVAFGKFYDRVDQIRNPTQAAAEALKELEKNLRSAKSTAAEFGLAVEKIDGIFRQNFDDDVDSELLALKDPEAFALAELEKEYQARLAVANRLGADITDVEELYALKRQQIVEQGLSSVGQSFRDFFDSLIYGQESAVAPEVQLSTAKATYDKAVASGDKGAFQAAAQQYLSLMRDLYASTAPYVSAFQDVLKNTVNLGGLTDPKTAGSLVSGYGREGDSLVAHINPDEAALLKALGGAGSINPATGLLEFYSDAGNERSRKETGHNMDAGGRGKGKGGGKGKGAGAYSDAGYANRKETGYTAGAQGGSGSSPKGGQPPGVNSARQADDYVAKQMGMTPDQYDAATRGMAQDLHDQFGAGDSFLDRIANFFAGLFGFNEKKVNLDDPAAVQGMWDKAVAAAKAGAKPGDPAFDAHWGFDPAVGLAGVGGLFAGIPGLGVVADIVSSALDRPLEIDLGPRVFGGGAPDMAAAAGLSDTGIDVSSAGPLANRGPGAANGNSIERLERLTATQLSGSRDIFKTGNDNALLARVMRGVQSEISALRDETKASLASLTAATVSNNTYLRYSRGSSK